MINFATIQIGDRVKVVGEGAPGFAEMGEELEIIAVGKHRVDARKRDGDSAFFVLTCGAARLEKLNW